jgi:hypothetical protein
MGPNPSLEMTNDAFLCVIQTPKIMRDPSGINEKPPHVPPPVETTGGKGKTPVQEIPQDTDDQTPLPFTQECEVLIEKKFSDEKSRLKSLAQIQGDLKEQIFYIQKSNLSIFRYEDVIFNVFPHLAGLKRRGATTKEIFYNNDPFNRTQQSTANPIDQTIQMQGGNYDNSELNNSRTLNASRDAVAAKMTIEQQSSASFGQNESSK